LALVLPFEAKEEILALAQAQGLHPTHITHVHSKPGKPAKRLLIALSPLSDPPSPMIDTLYIESETAARSEAYSSLTQDFYL
jgi:tRNA1Val (adenine37-N6)-methyltransferase